MQNNSILKVLVGSQAHGLATPESDYNWRGVFVTPTRELLTLGGRSQQTTWIEGKEDDTSWEVYKFLQMAVKCNPTVLEVFLAPFAGSVSLGQEDILSHPPDIATRIGYAGRLRALFPHVWNSVDVKNAFIGYGLNQRKKFLENTDKRQKKYAVAYLRSLYNGWELLSKGTFTVNMTDTPIFATLKSWKDNKFTLGEVIDMTKHWEEAVERAYKDNPDKKTNMEPVNEFLLELRKDFWE